MTGRQKIIHFGSVSRSGTLTVAGTTTSPATNVAVNTSSASLYADYTFASAGHTLADGTNTFTAIASDNLGRVNTNTVSAYLPASVNCYYDRNGNLTNDGRRMFFYDDENQLTTALVSNSWKSDFVYDGKMRRRVRIESAWGASTWVTNAIVRYIYDGNLVIQERNASNNVPLVSYTRGRDLSGSMEGAGGIGGLLARTDHSTTEPSVAQSYYHCDGNGNITCLVNTNQLVVARYLYDPYGNVLSISGPLADANLYRFSSKEWHPNSGLVYYLYRCYASELQRWLNRDPIQEAGSINLHEFVENDPVDSFDDYGLATGGASAIRPSDSAAPSQPTVCENKPNPCPNLKSQWQGNMQKAGDRIPPYPIVPGKITCLGAKIACENGCAMEYGPASDDDDKACYKECIKDCRAHWAQCMGKVGKKKNPKDI
jgi:RHS repeat-associated protein